MKILVTAFDPFGGETVNPAQRALELLPDVIGGAAVHKLAAPTVFGGAAELVCREMDRLRPDAVVCLGQAGGRDAVTPERVAINIMDARIPDNAGQQPVDQPIEPEGPAAYFSTLPVKKMAAAIRAEELPGRVSNTAGTFVCNSLLYSVLHHAAQTMPDTRCCFIHVPYIPEQTADKPGTPAMPLQDIIRALTAAIRTAAGE